MTDRSNDTGLSTGLSDAAMEAFFAEMRSEQEAGRAGGQTGSLPDTLTARILADAETALADRATADRAASGAVDREPARQTGLRGLWARILGAIGGAPALAGLAAATMAGVWIGITPPTALQTGMQAMIGSTSNEELFEYYVVDSTDFYDFGQVEG
ncbi:hypothetical protein [Pseudooceanicola algae]|nr:hypothetical protein [Pseudooceanicola algae]